MTKAQKWAKIRNFNKFRLEGIRQTLSNLTKDNFLTPTEVREIRRTIISLDEVINCWRGRNSISKKKFMEGK